MEFILDKDYKGKKNSKGIKMKTREHWNKREDLKIVDYAESKGWQVEFHENDILHKRFDPPYESVNYVKENKIIWFSGWNWNTPWRVAEIINGFFRNHKSYKTIKDAIDGEIGG